MTDGHVSPTRSKTTWKPRIFSAPLCFFSCSDGSLVLGIDDGSAASWSDNTRTPEAILPYQFASLDEMRGARGITLAGPMDEKCTQKTKIPAGAGLIEHTVNENERLIKGSNNDQTEILTLIKPHEKSDKTDALIEVEACFVGGFNANALEVRWINNSTRDCRWFALKTFTGMQIRYVMPDQVQPIIFALAGEDAYAYCDHDPCTECSFHCKRGFRLYAGSSDGHIIAIPLHEPTKQ